MENVKLAVSKNNEKKLPSNLEAEQALIGSVLVNNDIIDEISNIINSQKKTLKKSSLPDLLLNLIFVRFEFKFIRNLIIKET